MVMEKRSVATAIILSIVTCGLYELFWTYKLWDDLYRANGYRSSAGTDLLLSIVTCGIYYIYMQYKMGKMESEAYQKYGLGHKDDSVLYIVLSLFGLAIVAECIVQSSINNRLADAVNHAHFNNQQNQFNQQQPPTPWQ